MWTYKCRVGRAYQIQSGFAQLQSSILHYVQVKHNVMYINVMQITMWLTLELLSIF